MRCACCNRPLPAGVLVLSPTVGPLAGQMFCSQPCLERAVSHASKPVAELLLVD